MPSATEMVASDFVLISSVFDEFVGQAVLRQASLEVGSAFQTLTKTGSHLTTSIQIFVRRVTRAEIAVFLCLTSGFVSPSVDPTLRRIMHYDEDMHLVAETELTSAWQRAIAYAYVDLGDQPVAQRDLGGTPTTTWLVGDHLGTPFLQTASTGAVLWRVEAEPYGRVWALRTGSDRHQPLRFPGQEAEQLNRGLDGATERSYNIFRWYRPKWGRYSQVDPAWNYISSAFSYAEDSSLMAADPDGRQASFGLTDRARRLCTVYGEAPGTPPACQRAVASVILNRRDAEGGSICDIVFHSRCGRFDAADWRNDNFGRCADCFSPKNEPDLIATAGSIPPTGSWGRREPVFFCKPGTRCVKTRTSDGRKRIPIPDCNRLVFFAR